MAPRNTRLTQSQDGKRLYIHLLDYPYRGFQMANLAGKVEHAQFLHDGSEVTMECDGVEVAGVVHHVADNGVLFLLPSVKPNVTVPVIELFLK